MRQIQQVDAAQRLLAQFGLRGQLLFALDETIVPVCDVGDFAGSSPWEVQRTLASDTLVKGASGAGTYNGIYITPNAGTIAVIERLRVSNDAGAQSLKVKVFRPADVATVTTVTGSPAAQLNGRMLSTGFAPQAPITGTTFHHTDHVQGADFDWMQIWSAANHPHDTELPFPRGVILDGDDPLGPISLAIQSTAANVSTPHISYYATIYRRR